MEAMTKDLWVFVETKADGSAKNVGLELLNPGRRLADKQGGALVAVIVGQNVNAAVEAAAAHDADKIIVVEGPEEQKQKYLKPLATGETLGAFGLTEPGAGADASGQKTTAVLDGDHYVLNGSKIFITNAGPAGIYVVMAMTDKEKGNHGISAFIVEKGFPGFKIGKHEEKMGIRASSTCELIFEDCFVPKENLLGEEGKGFKYAMMTLDGGRIGIASQAVGIAQGAIDETVEYVKTRKQFGKPLSSFQNTQFELAQMQANTDAARLLVYRAACAKDIHEPYSHLAAMAKLIAAQNASDVTRRCLQLFGGYGYTREYPMERMMRNAKITEIYEGTSEVQKMVISGWMGVKRSLLSVGRRRISWPSFDIPYLSSWRRRAVWGFLSRTALLRF